MLTAEVAMFNHGALAVASEHVPMLHNPKIGLEKHVVVFISVE